MNAKTRMDSIKQTRQPTCPRQHPHPLNHLSLSKKTLILFRRFTPGSSNSLIAKVAASSKHTPNCSLPEPMTLLFDSLHDMPKTRKRYKTFKITWRCCVMHGDEEERWLHFVRLILI